MTETKNNPHHHLTKLIRRQSAGSDGTYRGGRHGRWCGKKRSGYTRNQNWHYRVTGQRRYHKVWEKADDTDRRRSDADNSASWHSKVTKTYCRLGKCPKCEEDAVKGKFGTCCKNKCRINVSWAMGRAYRQCNRQQGRVKWERQIFNENLIEIWVWLWYYISSTNWYLWR